MEDKKKASDFAVFDVSLINGP